ncbi:magnesium-transporting ATPase [Lactobacillus sp. CBA3605]|uniref:cation-translocating P-type ATPase n=1 Tax=Lactobacillus sp. CBA3605 TaxID=2099788 RepID=UPI000CFBDABA|nr:cation-transporting P-type ATPase [Lactobacillus sp. CBA3605]AVK61775.1 magnesium-transporting ATPase [Lactobacillus sp. CBA3605]
MFYDQTKEKVLKDLQTSRHAGLAEADAQQRLVKYGTNEMKTDPPTPIWLVLLRSFKEPLVIILLLAALLSVVSGSYDLIQNGNGEHARSSFYEATAIMILILINSGLSVWQTVNARKSLAGLKAMNKHQVAVLRENMWDKVAANQLVPGDIISVKTGDFIEADVRWIKVSELQVLEAHLTGESEPIMKAVAELPVTTDLGDRKNMGYSGSTVTNGNGYAVVVATGMATELGKIADLLQATPDQKTPIEKTINALTHKLMLVAGGIVIFTLLAGSLKTWLTTGSFSFMSFIALLSTAIALAVAAIPDALPAVLSIVLTIGATVLAKSNGLIKSLKSVETLGSTTYIASDKTGTLTKNEMTVTRFFANGIDFEVEGRGYAPLGEITPKEQVTAAQSFISASILDNEANVSKNENGAFVPFGNPTDVALVVLGLKAGLDRAELLNQTATADFDILRLFPFDSTRKLMSVVIKSGQTYKVITKGAPDVLLKQAEAIELNGKRVPIATAHTLFTAKIDEFAAAALRTLAVGERVITKAEALELSMTELEQQLTLLGLAGIIDPPREEVRQSVATLHQAKINVVMITGDHAKTAQAIAEKLGIVTADGPAAMEGQQLDQLTDDELYEKVPAIRVYARVSPEHKQRIIRQLQRHGEVVAMTGDGVNDAPALRAADIGIAMGINGTDVTKDSADLILLDDKFTTIEHSVAAGRTIFTNIKNFMRHELTTNVAEVLSLLFGLLLITHDIGQVGSNVPTLTALMVLWVNMVSDALPSFALGYDVAEADIMQAPPRNTHQSILANGMLPRVLVRGTVMGLTVFIAFIWAATSGMAVQSAQTVAFLTLVFGQLWHVFDARSAKTLFHRNPFSNPKLLLAVAFSALSSLFVTMSPFFNEVMGTARLSKLVYLMVIFLPAVPVLVISGIKALVLSKR